MFRPYCASVNSLDCREGHMKKNKFVCLFVCIGVKGQKNITCVFTMYDTPNQVFRDGEWKINQ